MASIFTVREGGDFIFPESRKQVANQYQGRSLALVVISRPAGGLNEIKLAIEIECGQIGLGNFEKELCDLPLFEH